MKQTHIPIWIAVLLIAGIGTAWGTNHIVTVGGAGLAFSPKTLTINAGDTVTFTNAGGFHNVHSDPGSVTSFRCSVDCSGNNGPNSNGWNATVSFPTAGTIGYYCDEHGAPGQGMFGTITVNAAPPPPPPSIALGGYMSGAWYTPGQSGHGFLI
ncbi:MAG: plastocyanin/azurin family copper-binding protein, partial [Rudaea sp.]